jgi:putative transposase
MGFIVSPGLLLGHARDLFNQADSWQRLQDARQRCAAGTQRRRRRKHGTILSVGGTALRYRKLHDDLLDQGETCSPNRVARLARLAGVKAPDRL